MSKVVTLTGAATELGRVVAEQLVRAGHAVVLTDPDRIGGRSVRAHLEDLRDLGEASGRAIYVPTVLERPQDASALIDAAVSEFGRLDASVNIAWAVPFQARLHELDADFFPRTLGITLTELHLLLRAQLSHFRDGGGGVVLNSISVEAGDDGVGDGLVDMTVAAISALTGRAAVEYATDNVRLRSFLSEEPEQRLAHDLATYRTLAARRMVDLLAEDLATVEHHLPRLP